MAEDKKAFILYADLVSVVRKLILKDRKDNTNYSGELFYHILMYVNDEDPIPIEYIIDITFEPIKLQLKRDLEKYLKTKEGYSKAGRASAEARRLKKLEEEQQRSTSLKDVEDRSTISTVSDTVTDTVTDTVNVKDSVTEKDIIKSPPKKSAASRNDYLDSILELWQIRYLENRGDEYVIINKGKERKAIGKIIGLNKKKFPNDNTAQAAEKLGALFDMCLGIEDNWLFNNMSPSIIVSKYNEIKSKLNEKRQSNPENRNERINKAVDNFFGVQG